MRMSVLLSGVVVVAALCLGGTQPASAAFISIDAASAPGEITVIVGDFEDGITVNGDTVFGTGNSETVTAAASSGPVSFSGGWTTPATVPLGTFVQENAVAELVYTVSASGGAGSISGEFCEDPTRCTLPAGVTPTLVSSGPNTFNQPNLSTSWSTASVPEPTSVMLFGSALAGICLVQRRRFV